MYFSNKILLNNNFSFILQAQNKVIWTEGLSYVPICFVNHESEVRCRGYTLNVSENMEISIIPPLEYPERN